MKKSQSASIMDYFETLEDPRIDRSKRHKLLDIIAIAICAVICGADSWVCIELFGKSKEEWFRTFLELPNGMPSHDTFGDVSYSTHNTMNRPSRVLHPRRYSSPLPPGRISRVDG